MSKKKPENLLNNSSIQDSKPEETLKSNERFLSDSKPDEKPSNYEVFFAERPENPDQNPEFNPSGNPSLEHCERPEILNSSTKNLHFSEGSSPKASNHSGQSSEQVQDPREVPDHKCEAWCPKCRKNVEFIPALRFHISLYGLICLFCLYCCCPVCPCLLYCIRDFGSIPARCRICYSRVRRVR